MLQLFQSNIGWSFVSRLKLPGLVYIGALSFRRVQRLPALPGGSLCESYRLTLSCPSKLHIPRLNTRGSLPMSSTISTSPAMNPYTVLAETLPANPTADIQRLSLLPRVRDVTLRDRAFTSRFRSHRQTLGSENNRIALLAFTRGTEVPDPCTACLAHRGPFNKCVVVEGFFSGSCSNCRFNSDSARCDLRGIPSPHSVIKTFTDKSTLSSP